MSVSSCLGPSPLSSFLGAGHRLLTPFLATLATKGGRRGGYFLVIPFSPLTLSPSPSTILHMLRHRPVSSGIVPVRRLLLLAALLFFPIDLSAQTTEDIITKYIEARGGLAKIRSIQSERVTGTIVFSPTVQGPFVVERERPLKMHMEVSLGDQTLIRVYDGKSAGWVYNPFTPNPAVEPMTETNLRNILDEADFEGPFIDYKAKGNTVEFAGKATVESKPAYKLKVTNKNGAVTYFFFDAATYFLIR